MGHFRDSFNRAKRGSGAVVLLTVLALAGCGQPPPPQRPPPTVGVVVVRPERVTLTTVLPGRTDPYLVSDVRPQVNGIVLKRLFVEGSVVRKGQPLYQIDPAPYLAALRNAEALVVATKAKAARYAALVKQNAIAPQTYDDALAAYQQAAASAQTARINLGYTNVRAPITGRIGRSSVTQGALVTAGQATALATIQQLDPIYVDITQSSAELIKLRLAMQHGSLSERGPDHARVTLQLENGVAYNEDGRLEFSEVTVEQATGAVTLRAVFPNPAGILLPGMFVRATIVEGIDNAAILVPQQGVGHNEKGDPTALVVDAKGMARLRLLKVAQAVGDKWLVTDGLKDGDNLIVEGLQMAAPDMPVHAVPASFVRTAGPDRR